MQTEATFIFEPHNGYGRKDPDGEPWPFGYVSELRNGTAMPVFELGVILQQDPDKLFALANKIAAAPEMYEALSALVDLSEAVETAYTQRGGEDRIRLSDGTVLTGEVAKAMNVLCQTIVGLGVEAKAALSKARGEA